MTLSTIILVTLGLILFEVVTSIDNAIINAEVLTGMSKKARKWFLLWGILFAVFIVRGLLPLVIVWLSTPGIGPIEALTATFSGNREIAEAIEHSSPVLLMGGGTFLIFLFFHWLFLEVKHFGIRGERFVQTQGVWFYGVVSIFLSMLVWQSIKIDPILAFGAVIGSTTFFIIHGFREQAEKQEQKLIRGKSGMSDVSKILYLEVLDATFSIDGVIGAFAFTLSVPLILIGNGIGAFILRYFTVKNVENIKKYKYLKNGAMYSILILGIIMLLDSFGVHIPEWVSPITTFTTIGYFFYKSKIDLSISK